MLQITELRIGNYLWEHICGEMIVTGIKLHEGNKKGMESVLLRPINEELSGFYNIEQVKPIKMTEEWANKTELVESIGIHNHYFSGNIRIGTNVPNFWWLYIGNMELVHFQYLHQLQNIFFELTGEELKIKQ